MRGAPSVFVLFPLRQILQRVDIGAVELNAEVAVRAARHAGESDVGDRLSLVDVLPRGAGECKPLMAKNMPSSAAWAI